MLLRLPSVPACVLYALIGFGLSPRSATAQDLSAQVAEVRRSFTLNGKTIPPEIFRDFGDGDLADSSDSIWVTVDLAAAVGSNLYFDPIRDYKRWKIQRKQRLTTDTPEEEAYIYYGSTANGLLVVLSSYNGGGTADFHHLHILDLTPVSAFDYEGKRYTRINLTSIRSIPLGDRWEGEVKISGNAVQVITIATRNTDDGKRAPFTVIAERP